MFSRYRPGKVSKPRSRRPRLEALEDRLAPAVINVIGLGDGAGKVTPTGAGVFSATTLRAAVAMANADGNAADTINLTVAGTYGLSQGELAYTGTHDLTIENASGGAVVVDAGGVSRVFDLNLAGENTTSFTVTFSGLTIQNGLASPGDAAPGSGGGIRAQGAANVLLNGVTLSNNTATADGGGIALESPNNDGLGTLTILNSVIANNRAGDAGGGVETDGTGLVTITGSTISGNSCVNQGGGVWLDNGGASLTMTGDVVRGNDALAMLGGGVGNGGAGSVSLTGCTIQANFAGTTGGGFGDGVNVGGLTVSNCLFLSNTAAGAGGGIQEGTAATTAISDTVFDGNVAQGGNGGGLFVNGGVVQLSDTTFRHNTAVNGGAVEADAGSFSARQSSFEANRALGVDGGAVDVEFGATAPTVTFTDSLFVGNTAVNVPAGQGGAIFTTAGSLSVTFSQFTGNVAGLVGGAIDDIGGSFAAYADTFNGNTAQRGEGGALFLFNGGTASVAFCTLVGNSAGLSGGAIFAEAAGGLTLQSDTVNGNSAANDGGGVTVSVLPASIRNTIIFGNSAGTAAASDVSLLSSIFGPPVVTDGGGNLIGVAPAGVFGAGTLAGVNPKLGPLENNGGAFAGAFADQQIVPTEALLPGSPAIGNGVPDGITVDQRNFPRPALGRATPSIGASEPQYAANATANQVFVESLYEVLLNRPADPGSAYWVNELNAGTAPSTVVSQIEASAEYRADAVRLLYLRYLHRAADPGGLQAFANFLGGGGTLEQVAAMIVGSEEYFGLHGDNTETFLQALYEDALGRQADAPGLAAFAGGLAGGLSRQQVASMVFASPEYLTYVVAADYRSALGRDPDAGGLGYFVPELEAGGSDQLVLAQILGSPEGFGKRA